MEQLHLYKVVSFSEFFVGETIDISTSLIRFSREMLVDAVSVLSMNFGNAYLQNPEAPFFSETSKKYYEKTTEINRIYLAKNTTRGERDFYCTYRTTLQLLRYVFSIPYNEYRNEIKLEDFEYELFRLLLAINETLYNDRSDTDDLASMMFYLEYAINGSNFNNLADSTRAQAYYCRTLFTFLEKSPKSGDLYKKFLDYYGIRHWHEYVSTIMGILSHMQLCRENNKKRNPKFSLKEMSPILCRRLSLPVLEKLSIDMEEYIAFDAIDNRDRNNNVDYRRFRECPLIKDAAGYYHPINSQMICELLYNSLYFVLAKLYGREFNSFYYKHFVEEFLYHQTMLKICDGSKRVFHYVPEKEAILSSIIIKEDKDQPDFYVRYKGDIVVFELKAIKLNGVLKEKGKVMPLVNEFYSKVVHGINQKGKDEDFAVRQLIKHITHIDSNTFGWDKSIPDEVSYYPVVVFENPKLVTSGAAALIQNWYNEELWKKNGKTQHPDEAYYPIVTVSIDTLFLYADIFKSKGFGVVFDEYYHECASFSQSEGWSLSLSKSFDMYMTKYGYRKKKYYDSFIQDVMESCK
ncbi:MAG: hypothetical protein MJZ82_03890 [Paludibacteraceae bacterium]|nr:hypothetical protein [Paludibacteraceae bacterium]